MFAELGLQALYDKYEEETAASIKKGLAELNADMPTGVLSALLAKLYRRHK